MCCCRIQQAYVERLHLRVLQIDAAGCPIRTLPSPSAHCSSSPILGFAGLLAIGRTDGNLRLVAQNSDPDPAICCCNTTTSSIPRQPGPTQQDYVVAMGELDQAAGTGELAGARTGRCWHRPTVSNLEEGDAKLTIWYSGPLSIRNQRGRFEFIPSNLQRFTAFPGGPGQDLRQTSHRPTTSATCNSRSTGSSGRSSRRSGSDRTRVLANVSDIAYMPVQLRDGDGQAPEDRHRRPRRSPLPGSPLSEFENGTKLLPPATRYAIAVTMPETGDLILDMPPRGGGASTMSAPGVLYTNDGTDNPPATLGSVSVLPSAVSYYDGFFVFPTQVLRGHDLRRPGQDDGVQRGTTARCLHGVREHLGREARLRARPRHFRRLPQRPRQQV